MNLRTVDLNLLVIFDALARERSVSRAAATIGVSQSAVSHALRRLRRIFNDDLLVRNPRGMTLTRRAQALAGPVQEALHDIEHLLDGQLSFDPKTSERTFHIRMSEFFVGCMLPRLTERLRGEAPSATLVFQHLPTRSDEDPGDIQLRVCSDPRVAPGRTQKRLLHDRFVVAMRRSHPAAPQEMTVERFQSLAFVRVDPRATGTEVIDLGLAQLGLHRQTPVTVPTLAGVLPVVLGSDLCAILPVPWISLYIDPRRLAVHGVPVGDIPFTVEEEWRVRDQRDPGHRWLRSTLEDEFAKMEADSRLRWQDVGRALPRRQS